MEGVLVTRAHIDLFEKSFWQAIFGLPRHCLIMRDMETLWGYFMRHCLGDSPKIISPARMSCSKGLPRDMPPLGGDGEAVHGEPAPLRDHRHGLRHEVIALVSSTLHCMLSTE